jgi:hypothetical protein
VFLIYYLSRVEQPVVVIFGIVHWRAKRAARCRCVEPDEYLDPAYIALRDTQPFGFVLEREI